MNKNNSNNKKEFISRSDEVQIPEPGIIDKFIGILAHPGELFALISKYKPRATDWMLPLLIYVICASVCEVLMLGNPDVVQKKIEKSLKITEQQVEESISDGKISREEGQDIIDRTYERVEYFSKGPTLFTTLVTKFLLSYLGFFLTAILFFFFMNFLFGEIYTLNKSLVILGLPFYIFTFSVLVQTIIVFTTGNYINGLSLGEFFEFKQNYAGFIVARIDMFVLWFGIVIVHGYRIIFKVKWRKWKIPLFLFIAWFSFNSFLYYLISKYSFLGMLLNK